MIELVIPRLGEGSQEARVIRLLKRPGEPVAQDEVLYELETEKATQEIESPCKGVLDTWLAAEGAILPVGTPIARIREDGAAGAVGAPGRAPGPAAPVPPTGQRSGPPSGSPAPVRIPPRTRALCRQHGISEEEMRQIPAGTGSLLPEDVERYLAGRGGRPQTAGGEPSAHGAPPFTERPLPPRQRTLAFQLRRSAGVVAPAQLIRRINPEPIERLIEGLRARGLDAPAPYEVLAYCIGRAVGEHRLFRSTLRGDATVREYRHLNLGIAVHCPDDSLATAVVPRADTLSFSELVETSRRQVARALEGEDQVNEATQLHLTWIGLDDVYAVMPILVAPAVAVLFMGSPFEDGARRWLNLTLTFDHRLINGVAAARFMAELDRVLCSLDVEGVTAPAARPQQQATAQGPSLREQVERLSPRERSPWLEQHLKAQVGALLGCAAERLDAEATLRSLGLSSLKSVELLERLASGLRVDLPPTAAWRHPTIRSLAGALAGLLDDAARGPARPPASPPQPAGVAGGILTAMEQMDDAAALAALRGSREEESG